MELDTPAPETFDYVQFADFVLDAAGHTLTGPDGQDVPLRRSEFALLLAFLRAPGRVLSRDYLLDVVARRDSAPFDRSIDTLVYRLRRKIEPTPGSPRLILTVPGVGYKFTKFTQRLRADPTFSLEERPLTAIAAGAAPSDRPSGAALPFHERRSHARWGANAGRDVTDGRVAE